MHPLMHCVTAGPASGGHSGGYPDGSPLPSVTMDLKSVYTMYPAADGLLEFMLTPSSNGLLTVTRGVLGGVTISSKTPASTTGWSTTQQTNPAELYGTVSDPRVNSMLINLGSGNKSSWQAFRTIVAVADVCYTGSSLMDSGAAIIGTVGNKLMPAATVVNTFNTSSTETIAYFDTSKAGNVDMLSGMPNTVGISARRNFRIRAVPANPDYTPIRAQINRDLDNQPLGYLRPVASLGDWISPVYDPNTPWKAVRMTGMDTSASVTVTLRHCVQYVVDDDSTMAVMSAPSPPDAPAARSWMADLASRMPTIETIDAGLQTAGVLAERVSRVMNAYHRSSGLPPMGGLYYAGG